MQQGRELKKVAKANKELQYFNIHLACCFGGQKYKWEGSGVRQHKSKFLILNAIVGLLINIV